MKNLTNLFQRHTNYRPLGESVFVLAGSYQQMEDWRSKKRIQKGKAIYVYQIQDIYGTRNMVLYTVGTFWRRSDSEVVIARAKMQGFEIKGEDQ